MAALTKGSVQLINPLFSDDTEAMIRCLRTLGLRIETSDQIVVHNDVSCMKEGIYDLFCSDSGTTARFLLALICIVPGVKTLGGSERLNERPIRDLVDALRELGARIDYCEKEGHLPVKVSSSSLEGGSVHLKADVSSQFCSALLLIAPYLPKGLTIHIKESLISKSYVHMTVGCMRDWGARVDGNYTVPPQIGYRMHKYVIESDFSSAAYFFAIAALTKSSIFVENINPASLQGDRKFLSLLEQMGNGVRYEAGGVYVRGRGVTALNVDMEDCPDQVMTLAVLGSFAQGVTQISGVRSLRVKETERVVALRNELGKMGIRVEDTENSLSVYGGSPKPAQIATYNDHRMAMAFAVAKFRLPELVICNPEVVSKTFPCFWNVLEKLC
jgi:3-phosphoshikimate 1-carboxyvinyltransferase